MKYLFLDIDGVLNSSRSCFVKIGPSVKLSTSAEWQELATIPNGPEFGVTHALICVDPVCVALVNRLLEKSQATLVLSSSHRSYLTDKHTPYASDGHRRRLKLYLKCMGISVPENFAVTPQLHRPRGEEVLAFIEQTFLDGCEPEAYVILDDGTDFMDRQPLVRIDANIGMSFQNYVAACKELQIGIIL